MLLFAFSVLNCVICESRSWLLVGFSGSCAVICATNKFKKSFCDNDPVVGTGMLSALAWVLAALLMIGTFINQAQVSQPR